MKRKTEIKRPSKISSRKSISSIEKKEKTKIQKTRKAVVKKTSKISRNLKFSEKPKNKNKKTKIIVDKKAQKKITKRTAGNLNIKIRKNNKRIAKKKRNGASRTSNVTKIKVVGVGGCGGNIATRLYDEFPRGVDVIVINTDLQDLAYCRATKKLYIGKNTTKGLGAGMDPEIGRKSAEENREEIAQAISGADMIFITAGLGGGTGSGATPIVAEIAKEMGILTIGVVTKPFHFEGILRNQIAKDAIGNIKERVDTLIEISNDRIFSVIDPNTSIMKAFAFIDGILKNAVLGVAELILMPGMINVDFADIKYVMQHSGPAIIGVGSGSGKDRAIKAANNAINSPLLETSIDGARGLLFSVSGRRDMKMNEVNEIAKVISENLNPSAKIIFGAYHNRKIKQGQIKVTIIATGFNETYNKNISLFNNLESDEDDDIMGEDKIEKDSKTRDIFYKDDSSDIKSEDENEEKEIDDDSFWDIPTFLRRGKKK